MSTSGSLGPNEELEDGGREGETDPARGRQEKGNSFCITRELPEDTDATKSQKPTELDNKLPNQTTSVVHEHAFSRLQVPRVLLQ